MIKVIFGNITFEENKALIHEENLILYTQTVSDAYKVGEDLVNSYGAYLIPSEYKGEIIEDFNFDILKEIDSNKFSF